VQDSLDVTQNQPIQASQSDCVSQQALQTPSEPSQVFEPGRTAPTGDVPLSLPRTFRRRGYRYVQLRREGMLAKYALYDTLGSPEPHSYEVFRVLVHPVRVLGDVAIPAREACPSDEQWGVYGWTLPDSARAEARFNELVESGRAARWAVGDYEGPVECLE